MTQALRDTAGADSDATAQEILVIDGDEGVRRGLEKLFRDQGLSVTAVGDAETGRDQISNRFFPLALIDLDTPSPMAGLELLQFAKERSPLTSIIMLSGRQNFDAVAPAFRAGALDVVPKVQTHVPYLRDRVLSAVKELRQSVTQDQLLHEAADLHDHFLQEMMALQRQVVDLEDKLLNREDEYSTTMTNPGVVNILLVDDEPGLHAFLDSSLSSDAGWRLRLAQSGGEALDFANQANLQVVVVKEQLPDLSGSMVLKSIKASLPDVVGILFSPPRAGGIGEVKMVDQSHSRFHTVIASFTEPRQLVAALNEVRDALKKKSKEKRYVGIFRKQHMDFLKRFNQLKQRFDAKKR